ncbi:MAG: P-II family nitrogen regulator, partial [Lachnospiraceae bacterium]|nr:P-II family nitrogen regulator [Lachnospiraceae bacterium]
AKGTGMELAEKFMGVSLASEKELVLIVTQTELKNPIMQAIMKDAGLQTKAKSIAFSLPVTDTAGLRLVED